MDIESLERDQATDSVLIAPNRNEVGLPRCRGIAWQEELGVDRSAVRQGARSGDSSDTFGTTGGVIDAEVYGSNEKTAGFEKHAIGRQELGRNLGRRRDGSTRAVPHRGESLEINQDIATNSQGRERKKCD
jgi:hypothetical protein